MLKALEGESDNFQVLTFYKLKKQRGIEFLGFEMEESS